MAIRKRGTTAKALGLDPVVPCADKEITEVRDAVLADKAAVVLICWHHEELANWPGDDVLDRLRTIDSSTDPPSLVDSPQRVISGDSDR